MSVPPLNPAPAHVPPAYPEFFNPGVDASGTVVGDSPCRKCGYNLRGLSITGRCPECGTPVGLSVHGDLLRFSEPAWVRKLQRGVKIILTGIALLVLGMIAMFATGVIFPAAVEFVMLIFIAAQIIMLIGAWMLTEPDPSGIGEDKYGTSRKIIRFALIVGIFDTLLENVPRVGAVAPDLRIVLQVIAGIAGIIGLVGQFAMLNYLSKLALRIPDNALAKRARTVMWGIGISYGVILLGGLAMVAAAMTAQPGTGPGPVMFGACLMMPAAIALLIFAIMYLLLLDKLRVRFREQAEAAEQTWARASG